jgi:hypothetical protein
MSRRLSAIAVMCGAVLFGWSLGGVASLDSDLRTAVATPAPQLRDGFVADRGHDHGHRGPRL